MQRTVPPFRADHVGSLLRSAPLREARLRRERGEIDAAALQSVEDRGIVTLIRRQQDVGLTAVTDGEYRRAFVADRLFGGARRGGILSNRCGADGRPAGGPLP